MLSRLPDVTNERIHTIDGFVWVGKLALAAQHDAWTRDGSRKHMQMKAIVYTKFGPPAMLQFKEIAKPVPKDNEVLIKVHASSVNTLDLAMRGPMLARIITVDQNDNT